MGWTKIKIRPADKLWSEYVRRSARKCEIGVSPNCVRNERHDYETGELEIKHMDCVHIFTRGKESTRFDPENTYAGCKACHKHFHDNKSAQDEWIIKKLGQRGYDLLTIRANTPLRGTKQMQDDMVKLYCKQELAKLGRD